MDINLGGVKEVSAEKVLHSARKKVQRIVYQIRANSIMYDLLACLVFYTCLHLYVYTVRLYNTNTACMHECVRACVHSLLTPDNYYLRAMLEHVKCFLE